MTRCHRCNRGGVVFIAVSRGLCKECREKPEECLLKKTVVWASGPSTVIYRARRNLRMEEKKNRFRWFPAFAGWRYQLAWSLRDAKRTPLDFRVSRFVKTRQVMLLVGNDPPCCAQQSKPGYPTCPHRCVRLGSHSWRYRPCNDPFFLIWLVRLL